MTLNLGVFINTLISFIIVAFSVFLVIKGINRMKREQVGLRPPLVNIIRMEIFSIFER